MSRGPIRILSFGRPGVVFLLGVVPRVSVRFDSECPDVAFCACVGVVSVLGVGAFLFSECEYWAFCASVELGVLFVCAAGALEVRLWEFVF